MVAHKKWDVFLSFSSRDRSKAAKIATDLKRAGITVWIDSDYVAPGDRVRDAIDWGIKYSRCVVVLISPSSLKSQWVLNELDAAMLKEIDERRKIVIPVLLGSVAHNDLPQDIRGKNYIDLRRSFSKRYPHNRTPLFNAVIAATTPRNNRVVTLPVGAEAMRYVLAYKYKARDESSVPSDDFLDELANIVVTVPTFFGSVKAKRRFLKAYGKWGVRQLVSFFLDHTQSISLTKGFTDEEFADLIESIGLFVLMFDVQREAQARGRTVLMRVAPNDDVRYLMVPPKR